MQNLSLLSYIASIFGCNVYTVQRPDSASLGAALRAAHGWLCKSKGSFVPVSSMYKDKLEKTVFGSKLVATAEDDKLVAKYALLVKKRMEIEGRLVQKSRRWIVVYKALNRLMGVSNGGFVVDVVAATEQVVHDGVDIINLSLGRNNPPATTRTTFLNPFDVVLLSAVKFGVFVAQAAGNGGPFAKTMVLYSLWIASVAAAVDDRRYKNHLTLGNGKI